MIQTNSHTENCALSATEFGGRVAGGVEIKKVLAGTNDQAGIRSISRNDLAGTNSRAAYAAGDL